MLKNSLKIRHMIYLGKYNFQNYHLSHGHYAITYLYRDIYMILQRRKSELGITRYSAQSVRSEHFQPRIQRFVIKPVSDSRQKGLSHTAVIHTLLQCETISEQIRCFDSAVKLPNEELTQRSSVCQKLEEILKSYYTACSVHLVGSSVNGLGLRGCDVDLCLQCPHAIENKDLFHGNATFHEEISEGKLPNQKLYNFTPKVQLLSIRKILQNENFEEPITVIPGRCPILNFCYKTLSCDLSISNSSAVLGTRLMLLCGKLDERIPKLFRIIIYWAKHSKLVGGLGKFKSYAIFLLMVYFLQTRNPPVLPPVNIMFEKTEFENSLHNWEYDILKYLHAFKQSENTQSIEELLKEFFFFYGNFDFDYIICPMNSNAIDRNTFASEVDCEKTFKLNTICIQDPINLSWNVTTEVSWKYCKNFLRSVISVCERYQDSKCWIPGPDSWGLASLINGKFSYQNLKEIKEFSINIPVNSGDNSSLTDTKKLVRMASAGVQLCLNYCLLFECHPVNLNSNLSLLGFPQSVKAAFESLFLTESVTDLGKINTKNDTPNVVRYVCTAKDTWFGRSIFSVPNSCKNVFESEHEISKKIDALRERNEKDNFYFLCECFVSSENGCLINITFRPLNSNRFIPHFTVFLKHYVSNLLQKYMSDTKD